jgi:hypothetical protein
MKQLLFFLLTIIETSGFCGGVNTLKGDTLASKEISIMTYNIKMLPRGANSFIHHFPLRRARLILTS